MILTESKSFGAARLQNERGDSHEREEAARYDEIHDVIERLASKMESETDPGKWRFAARVYRQRFLDWEICCTDVQYVITDNIRHIDDDLQMTIITSGQTPHCRRKWTVQSYSRDGAMRIPI